MAGVRRLFINDTGLNKYAGLVEKNTDKFADVIEAREYILKQAKLASKLPKIKSISLIESGYWRIRTRDLFISTTDTGRLRKWFVGDWKVEVDYYGDIYWYPSSNSIKEIGFRSEIWNSSGHNTVHPHISTVQHHACLGTAATPLQTYIKGGDIKAFCLYAIGYLESVNIEDSAGVYLGRCHEIELDELGNPAINEQGNYIYIGNEFGANYDDMGDNRLRVSRNTDVLIDKANNEYLTTKARRCKICNRFHNEWHMTEKYINGERSWICDDCKDSLVKCNVCGNYVSKTIEDKEQGIHYCEICASTFIDRCKFCGKYLFLPVDKESNTPIKLQLEYNKLMREFRSKTNRLLYNTGYVHTCDECKDAIKHTPVKDKIVYGTRVNVTENFFKLEQYVPLHTYKVKCYDCDDVDYIENMIKVSGANNFLCSKCSATGRFHDEDDIRHYVYANHYIRLAGRYTNLGMPIFKLLDISRDGKVVNVKAFKDTEGWKNDYKNNINKFKCYSVTEDNKVEGHIATIEKEKKVAECPVCHETLVVDKDNFCLDKYNNLLHKECAEHTYTTCEKCGTTLPVSQLAKNYHGYTSCDSKEQNYCMECFWQVENIIEF